MIQQYINSGILEAYVTGSATEQEVRELLRMKAEHPEVSIALQELEKDMEFLAQQMAVTPPDSMWTRISDNMDEIILREQRSVRQFKPREETYQQTETKTGPQFIEVEAESSHIRVHRAWKWVFAAVFILGKIFLACAIYFYLENRQAQQQLKELKTEIRQLKRNN